MEQSNKLSIVARPQSASQSKTKKSIEGTIMARGEAMEPLISHGDFLKLKQLDTSGPIEFGQIFLIVTESGSHITRVYPGSVKGKWLLKRDSNNPRFENFEFPIDKILEFYKVTQVLKTFN